MFYKALPQCLLLAVAGFALCTTLTAVFAKYVLSHYDWSWLVALVFGSIVSATDPVAVVALLKEMKMPHSFTILIEGESLLNDGVAIVFFDLLMEQITTVGHFDAGLSFLQLLKTCVGAPVFGFAIGKVAEKCLISIYISPVSEMTITVVFAYVAYFVAERFLGISAVLAVVLYGITLSSNKMCISPESESLIYTDWRLLSSYANTLIFMFVGVLVTVSMWHHYTYMDMWYILATYFALTLIRGLMVALFYPVLKKSGYGLNWKESIVLTWGGLRGAIGLALSLMLISNPEVDVAVNVNKVLVQVSGIIILTLAINATTIKKIMKFIKFKEITLVNRLSMGHAMANLKDVREKSLRICKREWKFRKADWDWISKKTTILDPYHGGMYGDDPKMCSLFIPYGTCDECMMSILPSEPTEKEMKDLKETTRKRVLRALKGNLWNQFRTGLIQRRTLKFLCVAIDNASDIPGKYLRSEEIRINFMIMTQYIKWLEAKFPSLLIKVDLNKKREHEFNNHDLLSAKGNKFHKYCFQIYSYWWFEPLIYLVISLHLVHSVFDIKKTYDSVWFRNFLIVFVVIYIIEIIIKMGAFEWKSYFKKYLNLLDFTVTAVISVESLVDYFLSEYYYQSIIIYVRFILALRLVGGFKALKVVILKFVSLFQRYIFNQLYSAYDIGRGFLLANEDVLKNMDTIVDFGPCAKIPTLICDNNIKEMLDFLDEFERIFPSVVCALKSNRAARKILNRMKFGLERFMEKSIISRENFQELSNVLFELTKKVAFAPITRSINKDFKMVLEAVDWITNDQLIKDITENHTLHSYMSGQVIQKKGDVHSHVYVVASGIVKVIGWKSEYESWRSQTANKLPNTDSLALFRKSHREEFCDYLTTSDTIGLLGFLQKTNSVTTVICEKHSELIKIEYSLLNDAEQQWNNLIYSMWRSISIKICLPILKRQERYKKSSDDKINSRLQNGILPALRNVTYFDVPSTVEDMLVVQGKVKDFSSRKLFTGPAYIPSTYRKLHLLDNSKTRPKVVMLLLLNRKLDTNCQHWIDVNNIGPKPICDQHNLEHSRSFTKFKKQL
ncbi:sodium/hydrogen exchanger 10-like [Uloborus diversus]|uniref:sodium/hydrogen exchanger 10-like n=1 Tax=Uloborus diversus TaxID=327109 RepID=UPI0024095008|nr:sodium/hydrogen exchanger 10-like [Uloborus diversus]